MNLTSYKVLFIAGKGGVGKTTISIGFAKFLSKNGAKNVLLCDLAQEETISKILSLKKTGYRIKKIENGIHLLHIDPEKSLEEYVKLRLRYRILYLPLFSSGIYKQFVRSTPGLKEITVIGKIWYEYQKGIFDYIVVDMPPTGHALPMLKLPEVYMSAIKVGPIYNEAKKLYDMIKNDSAIIPVTIPQEMAINETVELIETAKRELPLPIPFVIFNRFFEELTEEEIEKLPSPLKKTFLFHYIKVKRERSLKLFNFIKSQLPVPVIKIPDLGYTNGDLFDKIKEKLKKEDP